MWLGNFTRISTAAVTRCVNCNITAVSKCYSQSLETKYTDVQKEKILRIVNEPNLDVISRYEITKGRLKKFAQWKNSNSKATTLSDVEMIDGFNSKSATKLFDSIIEGRPEKKESATMNKIKGQFLQPSMSEDVRKNCNTVLAVYVTANSVCWTLINKTNYEVAQWQYFGINYADGKRLQITDIFDISWRVTEQLPLADVYVMKAEATTLRAAGSDPNNPKVMAVNLQKAQMIAMIVALINARCHSGCTPHDDKEESELKQRIYFMRPSLPFRLYGTLIGNERVTTDQTIEMLLQNSTQISSDGSKVYIPDHLQTMFRSQNSLQKDMLGHCLLLSITFMDLCINRNQKRLNQLFNSGE